MTLERAAVESWQDTCLGEGEYTYMNVSVHLQLGCGLELRAFGGVAGSVDKYSQKACTLVFPTSLHLQKKKKKCRAEKSHPQRQVWLHTLLPQCVGGTAAEHSPFLTCVTPN